MCHSMCRRGLGADLSLLKNRIWDYSAAVSRRLADEVSARRQPGALFNVEHPQLHLSARLLVETFTMMYCARGRKRNNNSIRRICLETSNNLPNVLSKFVSTRFTQISAPEIARRQRTCLSTTFYAINK